MCPHSPLVDHRKARWLFPGAGAGLLTAQILLPALPGDAAAKVATVASDRAAVTISAGAFLVSGILLVLGVLALNTMPVMRARRLVTVGMVLTAVGALWPVGGRAAYNLIMVALASGADRTSAANAAQAIDNSASLAVLLLTLVAFVLGPIVLAVGLWRAGVSPVWPAPLWLAGVVVVNAAESSSRLAAGLGMLAVAAALAWLGVRISATGRDDPTSAYTAARPTPVVS
jgi:uncharacterized membrane protein